MPLDETSFDETALLMPVPEAEYAVADWRLRLDPAAGWGIPAHITILYPFMAPDAVTQDVIIGLAGVLEQVPAFPYVLDRLGWFGTNVLYLAPEPEAPFQDLTAEVVKLHPDFPPYEGAYTDVVPHLTVGHREAGELEPAAEALGRILPIQAWATQVWLIGTRRGVGWHLLGKFQLPDLHSPPDGRRLPGEVP